MNHPPPQPPATYFAEGERSSPKFGLAFSQGCRGPLYKLESGYQRGRGYAGFCSPAAYPFRDRAERFGEDWYYGDHAFYRRGRYFRVTKNARQVVPSAADLASAARGRFDACHVNYEADWRTNNNGTSIIICPNSPVYMQQFGIDAQQWALDVAQQVNQFSDRPLVIRWKTHAVKRPIYHDLHDAWAVIVYNSACALDAILAGVPVFVLCPWSTFLPMGSGDLSMIETPVFPDQRERFLWSLAERQWTLDEIRDGLAWKRLHRG